MQSQNLFEQLAAEFAATEQGASEASSKLTAFVEFCKKTMEGRRVQGVRYNLAGQAGLVFQDHSILYLGGAAVNAPPGISPSLEFTQKADMSRPPSLEAWSAPFTGGSGG